MADGDVTIKEGRESLFLNEHVMAGLCVFVVGASLVSLVFFRSAGDSFELFALATKIACAAAMYLTFRYYKWDVTKGLMGGVLFGLMYEEAYLTLAKLWAEEDFDVYLVVGMQGSLYLAAAGMTFLMTIIITINHFFISYAAHGNEKNVILNRIAIAFKLASYVLLLVTNSMLGLSTALFWKNALQYLADIALLLLVATVESQLDTLKALVHELREMRKGR